MFPANPARGLDPHQGTVTLYDGETGLSVAVMNASPITAIRTAAASASPHESSPGTTLGCSPSSAQDIRGVHTQRLLPAVLSFDEVLMAGRGEVEEAVRQADVIVTATSSDGTGDTARVAWLDGVHINAVGSCFPDVRELDGRRCCIDVSTDRRESENEAGDFVLARAEERSGRITSRASSATCSSEPTRTHFA